MHKNKNKLNKFYPNAQLMFFVNFLVLAPVVCWLCVKYLSTSLKDTYCIYQIDPRKKGLIRCICTIDCKWVIPMNVRLHALCPTKLAADILYNKCYIMHCLYLAFENVPHLFRDAHIINFSPLDSKGTDTKLLSRSLNCSCVQSRSAHN